MNVQPLGPETMDCGQVVDKIPFWSQTDGLKSRSCSEGQDAYFLPHGLFT